MLVDDIIFLMSFLFLLLELLLSCEMSFSIFLMFSGTSIQSINLFSIANLKKLKIRYNEKSKLNISSLSSLVEITSLDLSECNVVDIAAVSSLKNLKVLKLSFYDEFDLETFPNKENISIEMVNTFTDEKILKGILGLFN